MEAVFFGYYDTDNVFAVFDVNAKKLIKRRDIVFHEDVLGHPFLRQYGLQPGFDILWNTIMASEDPLDIVDYDDDSAEGVVLATLKPSPGEVALATLLSNGTPEPALALEGALPHKFEIPVSEMTLMDTNGPPSSDQRQKVIWQFEDLFRRVAAEQKVLSISKLLLTKTLQKHPLKLCVLSTRVFGFKL